jgi:hypothetical protein
MVHRVRQLIEQMLTDPGNEPMLSAEVPERLVVSGCWCHSATGYHSSYSAIWRRLNAVLGIAFATGNEFTRILEAADDRLPS